jgi:hypothetical protein
MRLVCIPLVEEDQEGSEIIIETVCMYYTMA